MQTVKMVQCFAFDNLFLVHTKTNYVAIPLQRLAKSRLRRLLACMAPAGDQVRYRYRKKPLFPCYSEGGAPRNDIVNETAR